MMSVQPSSVMHWKMVSSARGIESKVVNLPARARNDETSDRSVTACEQKRRRGARAARSEGRRTTAGDDRPDAPTPS